MIVIRIQHHEVPFLAHFNTADAVRTVQGGGTVQGEGGDGFFDG